VAEEIRSISITGHLTLDLHSLNNEGSEGNQTQTRMVHIVDDDGNLQVVNGISGDMFKHIQAEHFQELAVEANLPLCAGCRKFDANRINADTQFFADLPEGIGNEDLIDRVLKHCAMDDAEGILITQGNRSTPRKSCVEFGWVVGLPKTTRTESYFHVKYDPSGRGAGSGGEEGANVGQNIFYRPASSGVYAVVAQVELNRVGFNDISRKYAIEDQEERNRRIRTLMESVAYTFLEPKGAHRNTQNPHILGFNGAVSVSRSSIPAPTASGLAANYVEEVEAIAHQLNRLRSNAIQTTRFDSQSKFTEAIMDLVEEVPVSV
jgi:CRISPR-associated protein Cst2